MAKLVIGEVASNVQGGHQGCGARGYQKTLFYLDERIPIHTSMWLKAVGEAGFQGERSE